MTDCVEADGESQPPIEPITWTALRDRLERSSWSDELGALGAWSLGVLERELGDGWLPRSVESAGGLLAPLKHAPESLAAWRELVEWALRLDAAQSQLGYDSLRRVIRSDLRSQAFSHYRLQLELGSLAGSIGWQVQQEPKGDPPPDLRIKRDGTSISLELRAALRGTRLVSTDELTEAIRDALPWGVMISGHTTRVVSASDVKHIVSAVQPAAQLVAIGAAAPTVRCCGTELEIQPCDGLSRVQIVAQFDHWRDLASKLRDKVEQTARSGATWIRIDWYSEVWKLEQINDFPGRAAKMAAFIRPILGHATHLNGVLISDGAVLTRLDAGALPDVTLELDVTSRAVRRTLPGGRIREFVCVIRTPLQRDEADHLCDIYDAESNWLREALEARSLNLPPELGAPAPA